MDLKKLREQAEAASPGEWVARAAGWTIRAYVGRDLAKDGVKIAHTCAMMGQSQGLTPDVEQQVANQEYIAAAQPKTVLALLDIIEAPRRTNAQIQTEREITATSLEGAMVSAIRTRIRRQPKITGWRRSGILGASRPNWRRTKNVSIPV